MGCCFIKLILNKINEKIIQTKESKLQSLSTFITKNEEELKNLEEKLEQLENDYLKNNSKCNKSRIVKIYTSIRELKLDNNRSVKIDEDKLIESDKDNFVEDGQFCIYINNVLKIKKIYKRLNNIWVEQNKEILNTIIESSKDICDLQGVTLENVKIISFKSKTRCIYSKKYNNCVPFNLHNTRDKRDSLLELIQQNKYNYDDLLNSDNLLKESQNTILLIQKQLELEMKKQDRQIKYREEQFSKLETKSYDKENEQYLDLFYKIDRFLENIAKLPNDKYYFELDKLINKYGRKASELLEDQENPRNIYCRLGKRKVICCNHHLLFIDYYKKTKVIDHVIDILDEEYGEYNDGYIWCNNCGQEINMSEYEVTEGFTDTGARIVTHEEIVEDEYESQQNNEIVETLRKYLLENNDKNITDDSTLNIIKIIHVLTNMMGIKLTKDDEMKLLTSSEALIQTNIKSKSVWIENARKSKPKAKLSALENAYNSYQLRNIILFTSTNTFLYLQSGYPNYKITKTFSKCKPSLRGYPLDKIYKYEGIDFISCILTNLAQTGADWSSLKKIKVKDSMLKIIDGILKDDYEISFYEKDILSE